ncbi:hypothetical protein AGMMS50267_07350 [Spirochaetia bacterium]|nr:hypothetical protein AGMMS50267_07350 [Spirochaetia bacterium]
MKKRFYCRGRSAVRIGAFLLVAVGVLFMACRHATSGGSAPNTAVTFQSVTADGSGADTTTKLTLTFDKAIAGLAAGDITLSGGGGSRPG